MSLKAPIFSLFITLVFLLASCHGRFQYDNPPDSYVGVRPRRSSVAYSSSRGLKELDENVGILSTASAKILTVNVDNYGTNGNGIDDDTQAFAKAWKVACSYKGKEAVMVVPQKKYLVMPIRFSGPCSSPLTVKVNGIITASNNRSDYKDNYWLIFAGIKNVTIEGGGTIDGNGDIWWKNSCKINKSLPCKEAPTALTFSKAEKIAVRNLKIKDAQQMHVRIENCDNVEASSLTITAPEDSPNTDGIHVTNSNDVRILSTVIGTGDDCISIVSGSQNVRINDLTCGPGHGISIGSLGEDNSEAYVSGVTVNKAKLSGTTNGVRIKTWQGGSGTASNIKFLNIEMHNVLNPIIIDQFYCDQTSSCKKQKSAVRVKDVLYQNINGTSASGTAINFECSQSFPCEGIVLENVKLLSDGSNISAKCSNVDLTRLVFALSGFVELLDKITSLVLRSIYLFKSKGIH